ncbi:MAG: hypothetical protein IJT94_15785 [Oscillibacter sp.]|nr:hypothetical protein [Oscillibacter sp.]
MPNVVSNFVTFGSGEKSREAFRRMLVAVRKDGESLGSIAFEKLIPMPEYVRESMEPGRSAGEAQPLWLRWSVENWGSKWDAIDYFQLDPEKGDDTMEFSTAWTPVEPVVTALSRMFPDQTVEYRWAENENLGMNVGEMTLQNGEKVSEWIPGDFTREAFELSAAILDLDLADYDLYLTEDKSTYEYRETPPPPPRQPGTERRSGHRNPARPAR